MIELKSGIYTKLKSITDNVYYQEASRDTQYPYIVFEITGATRSDVRESSILNINIYDKKGNNIEIIEKLEEDIKRELHYFDINTSSIAASVRQTGSNNLDSIEDQHRRRQVEYQVYYYTKALYEEV